MPKAFFIILITVFFTTQLFLLNQASNDKRRLSSIESEAYAIPAAILRITAFEFDGLVSDYLYLRSIIFIGSTYERPEKIKINDQEFKWLYSMFDITTDLDPYFLDPYLMANSNLALKAGMIQEANVLLERGSHYRTWDSQLPFFAGFNYFFFLRDSEKASEYLMAASRRPGASPIFASLASKLAFKANKTENSIAFLEEMISKTEDEATRKLFGKRIEAYKAILVLEKAVDVYRKQSGIKPRTINELVVKKNISELPKDPYGGKYYIDAQGNVRTTSEGQLLPHVKKR